MLLVGGLLHSKSNCTNHYIVLRCSRHVMFDKNLFIKSLIAFWFPLASKSAEIDTQYYLCSY